MNDTKSNILLVSIRLFSEQGYNGVTMRNIADAVKISAPALYNHFPDKKSLYQAAIAHRFEAKSALINPILALTAEPMFRLEKFVTHMCEQMATDLEFRRLVQWELLNEDDDRLQYLAQEVFEPLFNAVKKLVEELRPDADSHLITIIIFGMIQKPYETSALANFFSGSMPKHKDHTYIAQQIMQLLSSYLGDSK